MSSQLTEAHGVLVEQPVYDPQPGLPQSEQEVCDDVNFTAYGYSLQEVEDFANEDVGLDLPPQHPNSDVYMLAYFKAKYLMLVDRYLPEAANTYPGMYPVHSGPGFNRILLDAVCGTKWNDVLPWPGHDQLSRHQLEEAITLGEKFLQSSDLCVAYHRISLAYRGTGRVAA